MVNIYRAARLEQGDDLNIAALFTDTKGNNCFSIYTQTNNQPHTVALFVGQNLRNLREVKRKTVLACSEVNIRYYYTAHK